jgi:hypothetical protein
MDERPGGIVARPVVENAGHDVDLLRTRMVDIELEKPGPWIDLEDLRVRAVGSLPEQPLSHARIDFPRADVFLVHVHDVAHRPLRKCGYSIVRATKSAVASP